MHAFPLRKCILERHFARQKNGVAILADGLTQREVEVLRLIAAGKTDREIAEELFIGVTTVNTHVRNVLNKTRTSNRAEATAYAGQQQLDCLLAAGSDR